MSEAALPHQDEVIGLYRTFQAPLRGVGLQVHLPQVLRDIDLLVLCLQAQTHQSACQ